MQTNNELSRDIQNQIDDLTNRIARAQGLDEDVARELYQHIEDKVFGYLSGEVPVSEADAMLLAAKHFGNAQTIKSLLGDVHQADANRVFNRRLIAVALASFITVYLPTVLSLVAVPLFAVLSFESFNTYIAAWSMVRVVTTGIGVWAMWRLLRFWQDRKATTGSVWYEDARMTVPAVLLVVLFAAVPLRSMADHYFMTVSAPDPVLTLNPGTGLVTLIAAAASFGLAIGHLMLWPWWCDRTPRIPRVVYKTCGWSATWLSGIVLMSSLVRAQYAPEATSVNRSLEGALQMQFGPQEWVIASPLQAAFWTSFGAGVLMAAALGIAAWVGYRILRRFWHGEKELHIAH
ncbi:MAG: hypothetical protein AMXMBFR84_08210 [Candidatus Hydrogenedentota bacterium]